MTDLQRGALARDITRRLLSADIESLCVIDRLAVRLEQLRALSWTRRLATGAGDVDSTFHLVGLSAGSMVTRCNGRWFERDPVETADSPPLDQLCEECVRRWARAKGVHLYGLLDLAHDLATEDLEREALREIKRLEGAS